MKGLKVSVLEISHAVIGVSPFCMGLFFPTFALS